jgi:hypothetical protein
MLTKPEDHCRLGKHIFIIFFLQPGIKGGGYGSANIRGRRLFVNLSFRPLVLHDLHDAVAVRNVPINGKLVVRPNADDQGDCHAGGESEDIDKGVAAVSAKLADGKKEIIFEHALNFKIQQK